jgi:hypothetical protein
MDTENSYSVSPSLADLPEEILTNILQTHLDVTQIPILSSIEPACGNHPVQLRRSVQTSLCRVSKRFYRCASHLIRRNGLFRITCWLDPHLEFYYLSPTICQSNRTDMFQVPWPRLTIYLARDPSDAVCVQSVASVHFLTSLLQIVRLHHTAGLVLLPSLFNTHGVKEEMEFEVSCDPGTEQRYLEIIKSSMHRHLPGLRETRTVDATSHYVSDKQVVGYAVPNTLWNVAVQMGRTLCISSHSSHRCLGLKILRYVLVSMSAVVEPWNPVAANPQTLYADLQIMVLASAALIDALVVEPELFLILYGEESPDADVAYAFHHEICPCRYMPYGTESGEAYGFMEADESWSLMQIVIQFLHSILVQDTSIRQVQIQSLREAGSGLPTSALTVRLRCQVYIEALERYHLSPDCYRGLSSGPEDKIHFPPIPDNQY